MAAPAAGGFGLLKILVVVIIVAGAGAAVYVATAGNAAPHSTALPSFPNTHQNLTAPFNSLAGKNSTAVTTELAQIDNASLKNATSLAISYDGVVAVSESGLGFSSPLYVSEYKNNSTVRLYFNASSVSVLGPAQVTYVKNDNGTFTCENFNATAISDGKYLNAFSGSRSTFSCSTGGYLLGIDMSQLAEFNFTQLQNLGFGMKYDEIYQSSYDGVACTYLHANLTSVVNGTTKKTGTLQLCLSDQNYLPLSISANLTNSKGSFYLVANETSLSGNIPKNIGTLPGPVS